jgi:hypothetical protein
MFSLSYGLNFSPTSLPKGNMQANEIKILSVCLSIPYQPLNQMVSFYERQ